MGLGSRSGGHYQQSELLMAVAEKREPLTREQSVRYLLRSRWSYLPMPRAARLEGATGGPGASRYVKCEGCEGVGRLLRRGESFVGAKPCQRCREAREAKGVARRPRHGCNMCPVCDGSGERKRRRGDDAWDAYSRQPLAELERAVSEARADDDGRKRRLVLAESRSSHDAGYRFEVERKRLFDEGSYAELDLALNWLQREYWQSFEVVRSWLGACENPSIWQFGQHRSLELAIGRLEGKMPWPIRVPRWVRKWAEQEGW